MKSLEQQIKELPTELKKEVETFVRHLSEKQTPKQEKKLSFAWRGALRNLRDKYTSVELQHKALAWLGKD